MGESERGPEDFLAQFEAAFARLQVTMLEACQRQDHWPEGVAAATRAGLAFAAEDPAAAMVLTNGALARGAEGIARHERLIAYLGDRLRPGREEQPDGERLPDVTERAMAGGVVALVAQRLDQGRAAELASLAPEAIQFVLTPYLGAEEARRVAAETRPPEQTSP
jgi:hypothetical protein